MAKRIGFKKMHELSWHTAMTEISKLVSSNKTLPDYWWLSHLTADQLATWFTVSLWFTCSLWQNHLSTAGVQWGRRFMGIRVADSSKHVKSLGWWQSDVGIFGHILPMKKKVAQSF